MNGSKGSEESRSRKWSVIYDKGICYSPDHILIKLHTLISLCS